jgi:hypothetical protein
MSATAGSVQTKGLEAARMLAVLAWVTIASALTLGALGALPGLLGAEPREVRRVRSVEEAERWLGSGLALPSYYPSRLAWPPAEIRVAGGAGGAASLTLHAQDGSGPGLLLIQASQPGQPIPEGLLGGARELSRTRTAVDARPALQVRVLADGAVWEELRWERDGRALVLRTRGEVEELFRMAHSVHRRGAP